MNPRQELIYIFFIKIFLTYNVINHLDTTIYKGLRFSDSQRLYIRSYIKPTNTIPVYKKVLIAHQSSSLIKGECIRHL